MKHDPTASDATCPRCGRGECPRFRKLSGNSMTWAIDDCTKAAEDKDAVFLRHAGWVERAVTDPRNAYWGDPLHPDRERDIEDACETQRDRERFALEAGAPFTRTPTGFRDLYWCWHLNEPVLRWEGHPACTHCNVDILGDAESHTFLGHVKKPQGDVEAQSDITELGNAIAESLRHCRMCRECGDGPCCDECGSEAALEAWDARRRP